MLRVTTITRRWIDSSVSSEVCSVSLSFLDSSLFWGVRGVVKELGLCNNMVWFSLAF